MTRDDLKPTQSYAWSRSPGTTRVSVLWDGGTVVRELADGASLVLGRSVEADLQIVHPSLSRKHVAVFSGPPLAVEDLGSSNGTRVGGRMVPSRVRCDVADGTLIEAGAVVVILHRVAPEANAPAVPAAAHGLDPDRLVALVAKSELSALLVGETGVGKEVLAGRIHAASRRAEAPFVRLNCAALSDTLLESELFGHERGAFTGAVKTKPGLLETATGGTLFLDELGEMPMSTQAKVLRVIESREVLRVGGLQPRPIDVRFLAATNRDLRQMVEEGTFRRDLYFRLNGITLPISPLRERVGEIIPLATRFAARAAESAGLAPPELSSGARARLLAHAWPGNIRELRNTIERAIVLSEGRTIEPAHLLLEEPLSPAAGGVSDPEQERILRALKEAGGNQTVAADLLGISRRTLVSRLSAYGMTKRRR